MDHFTLYVLALGLAALAAYGFNQAGRNAPGPRRKIDVDSIAIGRGNAPRYVRISFFDNQGARIELVVRADDAALLANAVRRQAGGAA